MGLLEKEVRNAIILGVVLILLSAVIILGFSVFSIAKGKSNEGIVENQKVVSDFQNLVYTQYDDKIVMGRDIMSIFKSMRDQSFSIFVNLKSLEEGKSVSVKNIRYVQFYDKLPYVNYGVILSLSPGGDIEDTIKVDKNDNLSIQDDNMTFKDGVLYTEGSFCLDSNGRLIYDNSVGDWKKSGSAEFIDENSKFNSNLIEDITGEVVGICFTQL